MMSAGAAPLSALQARTLLVSRTLREHRAAREGASAGIRSLSKMLKGIAFGILFVLVSGFAGPNSSANAMLGSGESQILTQERDVGKQTKDGKRLVIVGAGISETLHHVFESLDTQNTGTISKDTLHSALVELKNRGFMTHQLSEQELEEWLSSLVEVQTSALSPTDGDGLIRFQTFKGAVEFAENHGRSQGWGKKTRKNLLAVETTPYGEKWKPIKEKDLWKQKALWALEGSFVGLLVMALPSYYIFPWYLFRFDGGTFSGKDAKKSFLKKARIAGKKSEFFS